MRGSDGSEAYVILGCRVPSIGSEGMRPFYAMF